MAFPRPALVVCLAALASALAGCGTSRPGLEITIYNRTQDDISLEMVPEGVIDPKTSPMYQVIALKRLESKEVRILKGSYHMRAHVDDWEGARTIKHDELLREDGRIEIKRDSINYTEVLDTLRHGRILD